MERVVRHWTRLPREVDAYYQKHLGVQSQVTWGRRQDDLLLDQALGNNECRKDIET